MHFDVSKNAHLDDVWQMILEKLGNDAKEICSNSSSFYKTQDGLECSLRKMNGFYKVVATPHSGNQTDSVW